MKLRHAGALLALGLLIPGCGSSSSSAAAAAFQRDPEGNLIVADEGYAVRTVSDGQGGAFLAWISFSERIWIRRVDAWGRPVWPARELTFTPTFYRQKELADLIADGTGGVLVVWREDRNLGVPGIYAQRVSQSGQRLWGQGGVAVGGPLDPLNLIPTPLKVSSDHYGGVIVTWIVISSFTPPMPPPKVFAQRISQDGSLLWPPGGAETGCTEYPVLRPIPRFALCGDGTGGAWMIWREVTGGGWRQQRIDAAGSLVFGTLGRPMPGISTPGSEPHLTSLPGEGALLTWTDSRDLATTGTAVYLHRLDLSGDPVSPAGGIRVAGNGAFGARLCGDGAGGSLIGFTRSSMNPTTRDVFIQRMDSGGGILWGTEGLPVCTAPDIQTLETLEATSTGGAVLLWRDFRSGYDYDLHAGCIDNVGGLVWTSAVSAHPYDVAESSCVALGGGDHLVAWTDSRRGPFMSQPYVQQMASDGTGSPPLPASRMEGPWHARNIPVMDWPNPVQGFVAEDDGEGGTLLAWIRNDNPLFGLCLQRLDPTGRPLWGPDGIQVLADTGEGELPALLPDGAGGAIVVWTDSRNATRDIYGQRVDANGTPLWAPGGRALSAQTGLDEYRPRLLSDGAGGLFVGCIIYSGTFGLNLQRFDGTGTPQWPNEGVTVAATTVNFTASFGIVSDGAGGAIVTWEDSRNATLDIYAQRVDPAGDPLWGAGGSAYVSNVEPDTLMQTVSDGAGGALVVWMSLATIPYQPGVRRVDSSGVWSWTSVQLPLIEQLSVNSPIRIRNDGAGGAFLLWLEGSPTGEDVRLLRLDAVGSPVWTRYIGSGNPANRLPRLWDLALDGGGGVYVAWTDTQPEGRVVLVQRFDAGGTPAWSPAAGIIVSSSSRDQSQVRLIPGPLGARLVWMDQRRETHVSYYAQSLTPGGTPIP